MTTPEQLLDRKGREYTPVVSPRLKMLLAGIFAVVALLGANSVYLVAITALGEEYQNQFYMFMFLLHLVLGLGLLLPFLIFAFGHLATAYNRPNRRAVRAGLALFSVSVILIVSGFVLMRFGVGDFKFEVRDPRARSVAYWAHVICPLLAIACYVTHRLAGPLIKWRWAWAWAGAVGVFVLAMGYLHHQDPRVWYAQGPKEGSHYFAPSAARTLTGNFIPARTLMMDQYCMKCHPDAYEQHYKSVHHFSSFNNKPYLFSVNETRQVLLKRDGTVQASRWCAGCHDQVPFFSGLFDDPKYDIKNKSDPTTQAGITCTVCHAITNINSVTGNADYTIDEPLHYPFAYSDNALFQWINNQLVKAKPAMHKKTFLKPFHRTKEFCSTCHKVSLPYGVTHYKEWLRGQNHYDAFLLSGQSGHGARSFYYPDKAKDRCADCHMPLAGSNDFGARDFDQSGTRKIHNHFFFGANTGLPFLRNYEMMQEALKSGKSESEVRVSAEFRKNDEISKAQQKFLQDGQLRCDIFAIRRDGTIEGGLIAPLRPELPTLQPGHKYLVEVVLRTLKVGHLFTQGTVDSNELWVDFEARSGNRVIGRSGALDDTGTVDPWSHFVNALVIDRKGNRIDRRNAQDIYVNVYNHQIPPGAGQVVHFLLDVPNDVTEPIQLTAKFQYRKFDRKYMEHVFRDEKVPPPQSLPITTLCEDTATLPVQGNTAKVENAVVKIPEWQRWNDYGIGLFLEGEQTSGSEKGELRQAEEVFKKVVELGQGEGYANLARIYLREKRLADAVQALQAAAQNTDMLPFATAGAGPGETPGVASQYTKPAASWVVAWVTGLVNEQNGQLDDAIKNFELILSDDLNENPGVKSRGFDFRRDYIVWNELGIVRFERAEQERGAKRAAERDRRLREAVDAFQHTIEIDPEDLTAHYNLALLYGILAGQHDESDHSVSSAEFVELATERVRAAELLDTAKVMSAVTVTSAARAAAAANVASRIPAFLAEERDRFESRLSTLVELLSHARVGYQGVDSASNEGKAVAGLLHVLHRELHLIYKLDDNAREAVAIHRQNNPAANHAAQSIVIYPLNRAGAPGLADSPNAAKHSASGGGM